jgi:SiaC family regulatory phosphoprotein
MLLTSKNIAATQSTPEVILDPYGVIIIKGRSMNKNAAEFYKQIERWINEYVCNPAKITRVEIYFEYFNSINSKIFISLLRKISEVRLKDKEFIINWYYEEDDEDILAQGENISSVLNIPINMIIISESDKE